MKSTEGRSQYAFQGILCGAVRYIIHVILLGHAFDQIQRRQQGRERRDSADRPLRNAQAGTRRVLGIHPCRGE